MQGEIPGPRQESSGQGQEGMRPSHSITDLHPGETKANTGIGAGLTGLHPGREVSPAPNGVPAREKKWFKAVAKVLLPILGSGAVLEVAMNRNAHGTPAVRDNGALVGQASADTKLAQPSAYVPVTEAPKPVEAVSLTPYQEAKKAAGFPESEYKGREATHSGQARLDDGTTVDVWSEVGNVTVNQDDLRIGMEIVNETAERFPTMKIPTSSDSTMDVGLGKAVKTTNAFIVRDGSQMPPWMYEYGFASGQNFGGTKTVGDRADIVINAFTVDPKGDPPPSYRLSQIWNAELFQRLVTTPNTRAVHEAIAGLGKELTRPDSAVNIYNVSGGKISLEKDYLLVKPEDVRLAFFKASIAKKSGDPFRKTLDSVIAVS